MITRQIEVEREVVSPAYSAGVQYGREVADGTASGTFNAVFEASMLSENAREFYDGVDIGKKQRRQELREGASEG